MAEGLVEIPDIITPWWVFAGKPCCRVVQQRVWSALQSVCLSFVISERLAWTSEPGDVRPCLYDCAGTWGRDCAGHPPGSHRDGTTLDVGYFTGAKTNNTQSYRVDARKHDYDVSSMKEFAPGRTARFLSRLLISFPDMVWLARESVWAEIRMNVSARVAQRVSVDDRPEWNHDRHMHLYLLGQDGRGRIVW